MKAKKYFPMRNGFLNAMVDLNEMFSALGWNGVWFKIGGTLRLELLQGLYGYLVDENFYEE